MAPFQRQKNGFGGLGHASSCESPERVPTVQQRAPQFPLEAFWSFGPKWPEPANAPSGADEAETQPACRKQGWNCPLSAAHCELDPSGDPSRRHHIVVIASVHQGFNDKVRVRQSCQPCS